ncbi:hypothetical protein RIEPE_0227 [Candidatus Riesia pediculicola USDA]|uniref:Uncharacterized protein n=1 Tax=Riesia pediculicola (strain USDA) TaxID=515618 RepID=D4G831_RIEPU|nr:hypothetical protein RIEPE_0227 [Candidatus Riesia pediculicola USDA]
MENNFNIKIERKRFKKFNTFQIFSINIYQSKISQYPFDRIKYAS